MTPGLVFFIMTSSAAAHEHGGSAPASPAAHTHRAIGFDLETEFALHLDDMANDEGVFGELEMGLPATHLWVSVGAGVVSGLAAHRHPNVLGLLLGLSLHCRPGPLELTLRALYDRNFLPGNQLVRFELRGLTAWRLGPAARVVMNYEPTGPSVETTGSGGISWQASRQLTLLALVGVAIDQNPHAMAGALLEWHSN